MSKRGKISKLCKNVMTNAPGFNQLKRIIPTNLQRLQYNLYSHDNKQLRTAALTCTFAESFQYEYAFLKG